MAVFPQQNPRNSSAATSDPSVVPVSSATVSVASTAGGTSITTVSDSGSPVLLVNGSGGTVYIGNSGVTSSTGYALAASSSVLVSYGEFAPQYGGTVCNLYGITASGTSTVTVYTLTSWPGIN
jgi:hypothetical protein